MNDKVGAIAGEVGQTPSAWNGGIFSMIRSLSENVMIPIAGLIISAILCYELITMVMDKNNMHEMGSEFFFRYLLKACIAVMLLSKTFDITMAIFDVGNHIVTNVFEGITPGTSVTFYTKMPETGNYEDGAPKGITVNFPKLTPAAPALSYTVVLQIRCTSSMQISCA